MTRVGLLLVLLTTALAGCATTERGYSSRQLGSVSIAEVMASAEVLVRREFGPSTTDGDGHAIVSRPVAFRTTKASGTSRDFYRGESTMRRIARFIAADRADGVLVRIRVDVERLDTRRRDLFDHPGSQFSDSEGYTPIERGAATTTEQDAVWTHVRRDYSRERAFLASLVEVLDITSDDQSSIEP